MDAQKLINILSKKEDGSLRADTFIKRLKAKVPNWDSNKIYISKLKHHINLVLHGKNQLYVAEVFTYAKYLDKVANKLIFYFETGKWDFGVYYLIESLDVSIFRLCYTSSDEREFRRDITEQYNVEYSDLTEISATTYIKIQK